MRVAVMIISHRYQFIIFIDPLMTCLWLQRALWSLSDQRVAPSRRKIAKTLFFNGMSPTEAEQAFELSDLDFSKYTRIAVIQNPFRRMALLYDRIAATDPLWRLRQRAGLPVPEFGDWLHSTQPNGLGAGPARGPRWRRHGAWSADAWADGRITHFLRAENADADLRGVFHQIGINPEFTGPKSDGRPHAFHEMLRYEAATVALIRQRYRADFQLYQNAAPDMCLVA